MPWTAEQYIRRVVVETATQTGRPVRDIAAESFALTLWTWAELRAMAREASVERLGERTDLAGLVAVAFHQPGDLQKMEMRYLKAAGRLTAMFEDTKARLLDIKDRMDLAAAAAQPKE